MTICGILLSLRDRGRRLGERKSITNVVYCNLLTAVLFQVQHELVHFQGAFLRFIPFKLLAFKAGGLQI